jgi:ribosomal protein S18 acetylase RimI-like enzyme
MVHWQVRLCRREDEAALIALWQACGLTRPWNDPAKDIARKFAEQPELFAVAECDGELVGSVMAGYEGHRGWINYLAVTPKLQRGGLGRALMDWAELRLRERGCPKINLQIRRGNTAVIAFYESLGFSEDDAMSLGKRLERDD